MDNPSEAASFRASARIVYRLVVGSLIPLVAFAGWLGWHFGGWLWLVLGLVGATVVAVIVLFGATFIYAMTQDGA